ncbi:MAG TPA: DUF1583 domain-containing protein [Caulifigura sp.]|nr:DUF1583 domain-containing protein [Caulifigura sp.]
MSLFLPSWLALARSAVIAATLMLMAASVSLAQSTLAAQYLCDFRQNRFDNLSLVAVGTGAINLLKPSGDGIRLTIPSGKNLKAIGFAPRFQIHGDFEIEMECLILNRSRPKSGFGSGPSIYLSMGSTDDPAASLGRQLRPDGRDVYGVFAATKTEK